MEGLNRIGLAEALYDLEQYEDVLSHTERALKLEEGLGNGVALAWTKRAIGLIHYQRGAWSLARRLLEDSLEEARKDRRRGGANRAWTVRITPDNRSPGLAPG
jgi:tetratricopeptide (TPR) repeat protein